ncbi:MAG: hypothetical protein ACXWL8_01685 [Candidatus Limnocylindria bacterium]
MIEYILKVANAYGALGLALKAAIVVGIALVTTSLGIGMVVWIPPDHFQYGTPGPPAWWRRHALLLGAGLVIKNILGLIFLIAGAVMALPLVPGPGLLFMLLGFSLLDFPGKRTVERRLLAVGSVLRSLNGIRARFKRPPLILDSPAPRADDR